ncbi:MAG: hypothetical protein IJU90_05685 [Bacteroidales bacterium]|nr:hypothetical protein [Bacteroidales bacterium]
MTNLEALKAEIEPYSATDNMYTKRLIDAGLSEDDEYESVNRKVLAKCAIDILLSFLSLSSESLGPTSQTYDKTGLEDRISAICLENGFDSSLYTSRPSVKVYHNLF